jgi:hypothetical protein
MTRTTRRIARVAALATVLALPTASAHAAVLGVGSVQTDNYKAGFNPNPGVRELRTWLAFKTVTAGSVVFRPAALPVGSPTFKDPAAGVTLRGSDGTTAVLTAQTTSPNVTGPGLIRVDPDGNFGPLIQERSVTALQASPIRETLELKRAGVSLGTAAADYTYDARVAGAAAGTLEFNGPGGRWYVGGIPTRLNWEAAAPAPPRDVVAPTLTSVTVPAVTSSRTITVRIVASDNVGVRQVRFAQEDGRWTPWQAFAPTKRWTLSTGASAKAVFTQVRDAAGNVSRTVLRRLTCVRPCV